MSKQTSNTPPVNLKEQNAVYTFRIVIRDRDHFYQVVTWLNNNVGKGMDKWTMEGRVLKILKLGQSANPKIYIFKPDFDPESALYLSLV